MKRAQFLTGLASMTAAGANAAYAPDGKKILLDPGHGMGNTEHGVYDPGCTFGQYKEAEMVLEQAKKVEKNLTSLGYDVYMTRVNETQNVPLAKRPALAEAIGADALVSLHINSFTDPSVAGFETFYNKPNSIPLATLIQAELEKKINKWSPNRGIKQKGWKVLQTSIPSALVEPGFLSNARDRNMLLKYPALYADAITQGIHKYFSGE